MLVGQCAACGAPATLGCTICGRTFCRGCLDVDERMCADCRQSLKQAKSPIEVRSPPSRRVVRRTPPVHGRVQ